MRRKSEVCCCHCLFILPDAYCTFQAIFVRDNTTFWSGESEDIPYVGKVLSFWQERSMLLASYLVTNGQ